MTEDKKIEEMAKTVCHLDRTCDECMTSFECKAMTYAKRFYTAGYRKASDVAREISAEIEEGVKAAISALQFENNPIHKKCKYDIEEEYE